MSEEFCDINDKGKSCCSSSEKKDIDLAEHWDKTYLKSPEEKLGWYETDLAPTLNLVAKANLKKSAKILIAGAGSTNLVDSLIDSGYDQLLASDISAVALKNLESRIGHEKIVFLVDDLTKPSHLLDINPVDLWIDRAVLHFFITNEEQDIYFDLLNKKVKSQGYVILAEFNLNGATKCSGLPVHRYSKEMLQEKMEPEFKLVESFDYNYIMPSGEQRPYIYTLFKKQ